MSRYPDQATSPPPLWLALAELPRSLLEFASLPLAAPLLGLAPRGDGQAVLVLPGFLASDLSTSLLRSYLRGLGYDAHRWELGRNLGWKTIGRELEQLSALLQRAREKSGRRVSVIGWSLGGVMARQLARRQPDDVRQVITLGSPFTGEPRATTISKLFERISEPVDTPFMQRMLAESRLAPPVPSTAISSASDGIVAWANCQEPPAPQSENVYVRGSHVGLTVNPAVLYAVADRLAQSDSAWRPFERKGWRTAVYPAQAARSSSNDA